MMPRSMTATAGSRGLRAARVREAPSFRAAADARVRAVSPEPGVEA